MDKKTYILQVLRTLAPQWSVARNLLILVEDDVFDKEKLDSLVDIFAQAIHTVVDKNKRTKLEHALSTIQKIQAQEAKVKEKEEQELRELEAMREKDINEDGSM